MACAEVVDGQIVVETVWTERELIKLIPGVRWDTQTRVWRMPLSWTSCVTLRGVFGEALEVGPGLTAWAWEQKAYVDRLLALRGLLAPDWDVADEPLASSLYPFQRVGSAFLDLSRSALLGDEMGTGKTVQTLMAVEAPAVVVCPNSVKTHWAAQARRWRADLTPYVVSGNAAQRRRVLDAAAQDPTALVVVNFEALRTLSRLAPYGSLRLSRCRECDRVNGEEAVTPARCQAHPKELNRMTFATVVVDEAHRIKDPKAQQTRACWALAQGPAVRRRYALTGTPLANHPGDLWSVLHLLAVAEFPSRTKFVDRYCLKAWNPFGGLDIVGLAPEHRDEFFRLLDPRFRRVLKAQVLTQLPPKVRVQRWVEMTPAQRRVYDRLEHEVTARVDGQTLVVVEPRLLRMRQMQLASSMVRVTNGSVDEIRREEIQHWDVTLVEPCPKVDELLAILEELGPDRQVAVCAESRQLIELAAARLTKENVRHGLITGAVPEYERHRTLETFQAGQLRVLLFTVKAGGVGLDMTAADTIVFLQRSWGMVDNRQAEDRVHRIGSEVHESVQVIDVVTRDSVEEGQIASLLAKLERLEEITRDRERLSTDPARVDELRTLDEERDRLLVADL